MLCWCRYLQWSADQGNADSQRIIGDYYYYKWPGIVNQTNETLLEEAAIYYMKSAENQMHPNAQAMFNLAYMHQIGVGKRQDFEMAKRYYDLAMQSDPASTAPCMLGLAGMYLTKWRVVSPTAGTLTFSLPSFSFGDIWMQFQKFDTEDVLLIACAFIFLIVMLFRRYMGIN